MSEKKQQQSRDPKLNVPEPWEHVSAPVEKVLRKLAAKIQERKIDETLRES